MTIESGGHPCWLPDDRSARSLQDHIASLLLYQDVFATPAGVAWLAVLELLSQLPQGKGEPGAGSAIAPLRAECLRAYGRWFSAIAATHQSWQEHLVEQILQVDNPFTQQAQRSEWHQLPNSLVAAAQADLRVLQMTYACDGRVIGGWVQEALALAEAPVVWQDSQEVLGDRHSLHEQDDWADAVQPLAAHYRQCGVGLFAQYQALRWQAGDLVGIECPDPVHPDDLVGYDSPRSLLIRNTEALLAGFTALHVLLYGSRGSGKSSLVKSLLTVYAEKGLRLVEVAKSDLIQLPAIVDRIRQAPQKFIVFVDDLSFEADEDAYKALKVVLEGNLTARPQNVVVYATSNRRHLIREFHGDRPRPSAGDEIHAWDTVQEKLSLSDRFGLTLTFEPADQDRYLQIVRHLASRVDLSVFGEALDHQALQWATRHNGRSGRTARQFIDFLQADLGR